MLDTCRRTNVALGRQVCLAQPARHFVRAGLVSVLLDQASERVMLLFEKLQVFGCELSDNRSSLVAIRRCARTYDSPTCIIPFSHCNDALYLRHTIFSFTFTGAFIG